MKTPLHMFHVGIAHGVYLTVAISVFFQDLLGLDGWIEFISSHWTNLHWGVGFAAICLAVVSYFAHRSNIR